MLEGPRFKKVFIRRVMMAAFAIGALGLLWRPGLLRVERLLGTDSGALYSAIDWLASPSIARLTKLYHGQALAIFYCSLVLLLLTNDRCLRLLKPLSSLGRMALTNYVSQCVIGAILFYGLGLYAQVGPAKALGLALLVYALQIPLSVWWLSRYRFGPLEWVWRSLTYGRLQPMKAGRVLTKAIQV
jgi:uncharacterized membrane protein YeiB